MGCNGSKEGVKANEKKGSSSKSDSTKKDAGLQKQGTSAPQNQMIEEKVVEKKEVKHDKEGCTHSHHDSCLAEHSMEDGEC
jgi:hypothetical protein